MTAQAGAALGQNRKWETLSWATIEGEVRRLQARIVKAVQQSRWNKAEALQHLLTRSVTTLSAEIVDVFSGEVVNAADLGGDAAPAA